VRTVDLDELLDSDRSLNQGAIRFPTFQVGGWAWRIFAGCAAMEAVELTTWLDGVRAPHCAPVLAGLRDLLRQL
jgi:hypothetical protein